MNLAMHPSNLQSSSLHPRPMISRVNEEPNPSNGTPPIDFGYKVLRLCLYDFNSILKV